MVSSTSVVAEAVVDFIPVGLPEGAPKFVGAKMVRGEFTPELPIICAETGIAYVFQGLGLGVPAHEFRDGERVIKLRRVDGEGDNALAVGLHLVQKALQ